MKQILTLLLTAALLAGCASEKVIDGHTYEPYGLLNDETKAPNVQYRINKGNVIWSIVLSETIIVPVWLIGFELYEPVDAKPQPARTQVDGGAL
jgi:hypothetical protein